MINDIWAKVIRIIRIKTVGFKTIKKAGIQEPKFFKSASCIPAFYLFSQMSVNQNLIILSVITLPLSSTRLRMLTPF